MRRTEDRSRSWTWLALALACLLAPRASADSWRPVWDHWYVLELAGAPAGWLRETVATDGAQYRAVSASRLKISRANVEIEVTTEMTFLETLDGAPVEVSYVQGMGKDIVRTTWRFEDDHVRSVSNQGGRELAKDLPLPEGDWLTPMAAHRYWLTRAGAGAAEISYRTLTGENGLEPVTITHVREGAEKFEHGGRTIPVTIWRTTSSAMPGVDSVGRYSEDGHMLHDRATFPFGDVVTRIADKDGALAAGAGPAPELLVSTAVPVGRALPGARRSTKSTMTIRTRIGDMPEIPSAGAQRAEPGPEPGTVVLRVDIHDNLPASSEEIDAPAYREPSIMVDSTDPLIAAHARKACRGAGDDPAEKAEALRRYVHAHISAKALDTAFATASETARLRTGDCSEHGVLLCAMMRAAGIPARVASGLVYIDEFAGQRDVFCWHMWTQALIDGAWMDYDATLDRRYDAVHVLTGTSSLAEGESGQELASIIMLIGNLEIDVADVSAGE